MRLSKYFLMAAAAMSLFACSNDENEGTVSKGDKMTLVTLSLGNVQSRALDQDAAGLYNEVTKLRFEFFAADGRNLNVPQPITEQAIKDLATGHKATIAIENVPMNAKTIAVIANEMGTIDTGTLTDALKTVVKLHNMYEDNKDLEFNQQHSVLTGQAAVGDPSTEGGAVEVAINIKPVSSRLEIGKLTAEKSGATEETAVDIKDFEVLGIYVNQFYTEGALDPKFNEEGRAKVANGSTVSNYSLTHYSAISMSDFTDYGFMCDDFTQNPLTGAAYTQDNSIWQVTPADGKYYGYPVLAGDDQPLEGGLSDVANIVIKLNVSFDKDLVDQETGVVTLPAGEPKVKFLTITGYKKVSGNESITKFVRGEVYRMDNVAFKITDLTDVPYEGEKAINATVNVLPWVSVPVTPEIQ